MARRNYTPEMKEEIVQAYVAGDKVKTIAEAFDVPESSIYGLLHRAGYSFQVDSLVPTVSTVTVDEHDTVQTIMRAPTPGKKDTWKVEFTGVIMVQAGSIFEALTEVKKLVSVQKITSASLQGNHN